MRMVVAALATALLFACQPNANTDRPTSSDERTGPSAAADCGVALKFINEYAKFCMPPRKAESPQSWITRNALLTENFKKTHNQLLTEAYRKDPELGLDFDPIFDAQDFPDEGLEIVDCDSKSGYVTVRGKEWQEFTLVLKVVPQHGGWLVDGAGVINIPAEKQEKRE